VEGKAPACETSLIEMPKEPTSESFWIKRFPKTESEDTKGKNKERLHLP
jgi:hypothetical protein